MNYILWHIGNFLNPKDIINLAKKLFIMYVTPVITYILLSFITIVSIISFPPNIPSIENLRQPDLFNKLKFNAYMVWHKKEWYRLITSGFIHSSWFHLIVNMLVLYFFGRVVENEFIIYFGLFKGRLLFLLLFLTGIIVSSIPDLIRYRNQYYYNAIGSSGAVSSILFTSILLYPWAKIFIFPIPIPIPAILFGIIYLGYEYYMDKRETDNIGHKAHFWGALWGLIFPILLSPQLLARFFEQLF